MSWMSFFFRRKSVPGPARHEARELGEIIAQLRSGVGGLNSPATEEDLAELSRICGKLPPEVWQLYRNHDGSDGLPRAGKRPLVARLMPVHEACDTCAALSEIDEPIPQVGSIAWLWTDDNSNYAGVYVDGPLQAWICVLDHEEPMLTPAFRSTESFLSRLLDDACRSDPKRPAYVIPRLPREVPLLIADAAHLESDRQLASLFRQRYAEEADEELRRLYAQCAICLTPVEDTAQVLTFLQDPDMWTPEAAIRLLEVRGWREGIEEIERLARDGRPNGDGAALRLLVRMNTDQSRDAIARLRRVLQGQKFQSLEMWANRKTALQPPRW
jgi:hypothetical protein